MNLFKILRNENLVNHEAEILVGNDKTQIQHLNNVGCNKNVANSKYLDQYRKQY